MKTTIPGLKVSHQMITPACRTNRGPQPAFQEGARRIEETYSRYAAAPENEGVTWHLVLVREETKEPAPESRRVDLSTESDER